MQWLKAQKLTHYDFSPSVSFPSYVPLSKLSHISVPMFVHLQNGGKVNRSIYLLKFLEGLNEIIYVRWVVSWLTNKCSWSAGWKLFVFSIISFFKHLLSPPSLLSSSWSSPLPSVNQLVWSVSLSPTLPLPPHQSSHPPLSRLYLSLTSLSLSFAPLCSPVSHKTSASSWPTSDSAES